ETEVENVSVAAEAAFHPYRDLIVVAVKGFAKALVSDEVRGGELEVIFEDVDLIRRIHRTTYATPAATCSTAPHSSAARPAADSAKRQRSSTIACFVRASLIAARRDAPLLKPLVTRPANWRRRAVTATGA